MPPARVDTARVDTLWPSLADWLSDMGLVQAGHTAAIGRYIDSYGQYAMSYEDELLRVGRREPDDTLEDTRPK